jgi:hypothetical protein
LSRFLENPDMSHWKAAKHVLRYLKGTINLRLTFLKNSNVKLIGDSDADWSGDLNDRRSTTGYYFKFEGDGGAISWEVKKRQQLRYHLQKQNIKLWQQQYKKQSTLEH